MWSQQTSLWKPSRRRTRDSLWLHLCSLADVTLVPNSVLRMFHLPAVALAVPETHVLTTCSRNEHCSYDPWRALKENRPESVSAVPIQSVTGVLHQLCIGIAPAPLTAHLSTIFAPVPPLSTSAQVVSATDGFTLNVFGGTCMNTEHIRWLLNTISSHVSPLDLEIGNVAVLAGQTVIWTNCIHDSSCNFK